QLKQTLTDNLKNDINVSITRYFESQANLHSANIKKESVTHLLNAMEKNVVDVVSTKLITKIPIPDPELKGKIIGKEGRNIRAFEQYGGVDIIVDEAPGYVTISSFHPIRREIAARALTNLIKDGRIQPVKIEEE